MFMVLPWSVCLCVCVCVCVTTVSIRLVTTETIFPRGGAVFTPLRPASHERHRELSALAPTFRHFGPCQSRFWSVTKQREMFTTSRAISAHTSSPTLPLPQSCPLSPVPAHKRCRPVGRPAQAPLLPCAVRLPLLLLPLLLWTACWA